MNIYKKKIDISVISYYKLYIYIYNINISKLENKICVNALKINFTINT